MCKFGIVLLFPCLIFVGVYGDYLFGSSNGKPSDRNLRSNREYRGFDEHEKKKNYGDFVFPNSNQLVFPDPDKKDLNAEETSWFQKVKSKFEDLIKGNFRKSDKSNCD